LPDAQFLIDEHLQTHIIRDCCVHYIIKGEPGTVLPVPGLGVG